MNDQLRAYLTCRKCGGRLTPEEVMFYGTESPPRCNTCRTVRRNSSNDRLQAVVAPYVTRTYGGYGGSTTQVMGGILFVSLYTSAPLLVDP